MRKIKKVGDKTPPVGLEPTIFGLEVQRVIHYATRAFVGIFILAYTMTMARQRCLVFFSEKGVCGKSAHRGARTHDHQLKRLALYRLS